MSRRPQFVGAFLFLGVLVVFLVGFIIEKAKRTHNDFELFNAAAEGDLEQVRSCLLQGARINRQFPTTFNWTPLENAIFHNKTNVAHYLIQAGADINLPDRSGKTPLMWVTSHGDEDVPLVKELIAHGANLHAKDKDGFTAIDYARGSPPKLLVVKTLETAQREEKAKPDQK